MCGAVSKIAHSTATNTAVGCHSRCRNRLTDPAPSPSRLLSLQRPRSNLRPHELLQTRPARATRMQPNGFRATWLKMDQWQGPCRVRGSIARARCANKCRDRTVIWAQRRSAGRTRRRPQATAWRTARPQSVPSGERSVQTCRAQMSCTSTLGGSHCKSLKGSRLWSPIARRP
jgi:hypothetical protein